MVYSKLNLSRSYFNLFPDPQKKKKKSINQEYISKAMKQIASNQKKNINKEIGRKIKKGYLWANWRSLGHCRLITFRWILSANLYVLRRPRKYAVANVISHSTILTYPNSYTTDFWFLISSRNFYFFLKQIIHNLSLSLTKTRTTHTIEKRSEESEVVYIADAFVCPKLSFFFLSRQNFL